MSDALAPHFQQLHCHNRAFNLSNVPWGRVAGWYTYLGTHPNPQFWFTLECLGVENYCILCDHLVYVLWVICCILKPFVINCYICPIFGILYQEKSGKPTYGKDLRLTVVTCFY
jgi:hypothetical protein